MGFFVLSYLNNPNYSGPIQWARGDVGLKSSAAARPWTLAYCEWRAAAPGLKPLRLPRAQRFDTYIETDGTLIGFMNPRLITRRFFSTPHN